MYNIAIADDDMNICAKIIHYLGIFFPNNNYLVDDYSDGDELIKSIRNENASYNIIFLDIEMKTLDGIKTAELLRNIDIYENIFIIFISSYQEKLMSLFKYHPFDFLSKPIDYNEFKSTMTKIINYDKKHNRRIKITLKKSTYYFYANEIMYIESFGRKIIIHTTSHNYCELPISITEVENILNDFDNSIFLRIHKSFIVNMLYVNSISSRSANIDNKELPIGRHYMSNIISIQKHY